VRRYEFTAAVEASILSERRAVAPFGLAGGLAGAPGRNAVERRDGRVEALPGRARLRLEPGDRLCIETPGGGGFGTPPGLATRSSAP
jgi:N-methylhydantoinase B/oxoprolinase/acetone carboxylase alpha subunit